MRIPLFLRAFLSALSPYVSIQQRPIIPSGSWGADACKGGEVRRGLLEDSEDVALDTCREVIGGFGDEGTTRDGLIQLDVAVGDALAVLLGHLGDDFAVTALEAVLDEPLADEFLGELLLLFATLEALFVAFGIEVAGGVGRVDLVDEVDLPSFFPNSYFVSTRIRPRSRAIS